MSLVELVELLMLLMDHVGLLTLEYTRFLSGMLQHVVMLMLPLAETPVLEKK